MNCGRSKSFQSLLPPPIFGHVSHCPLLQKKARTPALKVCHLAHSSHSAAQSDSKEGLSTHLDWTPQIQISLDLTPREAEKFPKPVLPPKVPSFCQAHGNFSICFRWQNKYISSHFQVQPSIQGIEASCFSKIKQTDISPHFPHYS